MRTLLLVVVAVAGVVAGWQLRGIASENITFAVPASASTDPSAADSLTTLAPAQSYPNKSTAALAPLDSLEAFYDALVGLDSAGEAAVRAQLQGFIDKRAGQLTQQQRWPELLAFYQRLVNLDPHIAEYYYRLADVQVQLQLYDQALYSLYFILQDPVMGPKAQALEQRISQRLQFAEGITVPLFKNGAHHVVEARLLSGTLRLLVDTGASITTLTPAAARRLNLRYDLGRSISLATAGGLVSAPVIEVSDFMVGGAAVDRLQVGILPLVGDNGFDGLLGMNFLQQFASSINQQDGLLHLQNKRQPAKG